GAGAVARVTDPPSVLCVADRGKRRICRGSSLRAWSRPAPRGRAITLRALAAQTRVAVCRWNDEHGAPVGSADADGSAGHQQDAVARGVWVLRAGGLTRSGA